MVPRTSPRTVAAVFLILKSGFQSIPVVLARLLQDI
jgi:hypothetical protein